MKSNFKFPGKQQGAIAVEAALLIPVFLLVMVVGAMLADFFLAQQRLHRSTAALADVLANQPLNHGESLFVRIENEWDATTKLFNQMALPVRPDQEVKHQLQVSYLDTTLLTDGGVAQVAGDELECASGAEDMLVVAQSLITPSNVARSELVRVEVCMHYQPLIPMTQWVLPEHISSHFVAQRRYWRAG